MTPKNIEITEVEVGLVLGGTGPKIKFDPTDKVVAINKHYSTVWESIRPRQVLTRPFRMSLVPVELHVPSLLAVGSGGS